MNVRELVACLGQRLTRRDGPVRAPAPAPATATGEPVMDFLCNVCAQSNLAVPRAAVENRECPSCRHCGSNLRMRSIVNALSVELFGRSLLLTEFPRRKDIRGLGMSDWDGYARLLGERLAYTNTFYHAEPHMDITDLDAGMEGRWDFLISTDVFEHIPPEGLESAFRNSRRLLVPGGVFVFSVPYHKTGETLEHFPELHEFTVIGEGESRRLVNTTADGREQAFDDLVFHGGEGMTLEMRVFAEPDLLRRLQAAGFSSIDVRIDHVPELGILWPMDWAVPIVARA
jgi:SAM-dependent methyltransferase